jgi:hypothetical protein
MIPKYLATLAVAVFLTTFAASSLQFATRSQVLSGRVVDETFPFEFTVDADSSHTYKISPTMKKFLEENLSFYTEGPARVVSATVEVTPKDVSWSENRTTITSTGAGMIAHVKWDTPADSANGAYGQIFLNIPEIPGLEGKTRNFRSGGYQKDDKGRYVIREVNTYKNSILLAFARFAFALTAGIPFGVLLHSIFWIFVLKNEKRSRLAALPPQGSELPRTFYPNPIAEWSIWTLLFGIGGFVSSMLASFSVYDGFMSSSFTWVIFGMLAAMGAIALLAVYFTARSAMTVGLDANGISYARGRGDLQWITIAWGEILQLTEKSRTYRGSVRYWIELQFRDNRKKLKLTQSIEGYATLRDMLFRVFTPAK